jgi:hypothetical protein
MHRLEATVLFYLPMEKMLIQIIQQDLVLGTGEDVVLRGDVQGKMWVTSTFLSVVAVAFLLAQ